MLNRQLKLRQVNDWLESPVTRRLLDLISEHLEANKVALSGLILGTEAENIDKQNAKLILLKGQIHTLELLSDLKLFLEIEEEDEKIQTIDEQIDHQDN